MNRYKKCCIDSCIWIKYAGHFRTATLPAYIKENNLLVYADYYLLSEIHEALLNQFDFSIKEADTIIELILPFVIISAPKNIYRISKDPKDNYLYDLCIQNNCSYLITIDKELLLDVNEPFFRKTDAWLKKKK